MRFFVDTEFIHDPPVLQLVSLGIVAEDGREYYAVSNEWEATRADSFVMEEVVPRLGLAPSEWLPLTVIRDEVATFTASAPRVEFWALNGAFDWFQLVNLFGKLDAVPDNWPRSCWDLKQWEWHLGGLGREARRVLANQSGELAHNALVDARQNRLRWELLAELAEKRRRSHVGRFRDEVLAVLHRRLASGQYQDRSTRRLVARLDQEASAAVKGLSLVSEGVGRQAERF